MVKIKIFNITDLASNLIKPSDFEPNEDIEIKFTGLRAGEKLYEELLLDDEGILSTGMIRYF